ncbi:MAG: hypothetical protein HONBIEJF_02931 [Fimbriimonadaceae bacterium]|nr:hypothetical protein [Fimbriimonadaceae bacterium]
MASPSKDQVRRTGESVSPGAVEAATGHPLEHWRHVLTSFDVAKNGHKAAANHLESDHGVDPWWAQNLTVWFEQETGLRLPGQRSDGSFCVNVSRTIQATPEEVFAAWTTADGMDSWFSSGTRIDLQVGGQYANDDKDTGVYRKIIPIGPVRNSQGEVGRLEFTWENAEHCPGSLVTIQFIDKENGKTAVLITHDKLPGPDGCESMKKGWSWALESLKSHLETGKRIRYEDWLAARD